MTIYKWKQGSRVNFDAQKVGEVCERLEKKGKLTPTALVDASRRSNAPLHNLFEWDNEKAAEKYRETQAAYLIRSIEVVVTGVSEPVRAFVSVNIDGESRQYMNVETAMKSEPTRDQVLSDALIELESFKRKYSNLKELASVISAIDELIEKVA